MDRRERLLVHQIHPAKLATDISVAIVSTVFFWRHEWVAALAVIAVPAPVASALLMRSDLSRWRATAAGQHVLTHMTTPMMAVRSAGAVVMALGGWWRSPALIAASVALIVLGWSRGLFVRR
ncbi:MAG TPA: hypothetical protein VIG99_17410 [Myxococcaceae bacterium]|jgi:hypothetical protein